MTPSRPSCSPAQAAAELLRRRRARQSLEGFTAYTKADYSWNWHHRLICRKLDDLLAGRITRLIVCAPFRHGKSELASVRFPAYALGRNPDLQIIACSHTDDKASEFNRYVQDVMTQPAYNRLFPEANLTGGEYTPLAGRTYKRTEDLFEMVGRRGYYKSSGVGGAIVGAGFDVGIIDDPIRDAADAYSPARRQAVWDWYTMAFRSRKAPNARILLITTRWHIDDLAGRLLKMQKEDPEADRWELLSLPAIAEGGPDQHPEDHRKEGEPLWPERFDAKTLASDRATMKAFGWAAGMQQRPVPREGALFREEWFGESSFLDTGDGFKMRDGFFFARRSCDIFAIMDPSTGAGPGGDHTAIGVFALTPRNELLVVQMYRQRLGLHELIPFLRSVCGLHLPQWVGIEDVGFQKAVLKDARAANLPVRAVSPGGSGKASRATPAVLRAEQGKIYLPSPQPAWVRVFLDELIAFTGADGGQDDQVDCLSYAVQELDRRGLDGSGGRPIVLGERQRIL